MCDKVVSNKLCMLLFVPDHFWMQEMCNDIMRTIPDAFHLIPDCFKTQKMCGQAIKEDSSSLQFVPDWFVTREGTWMWFDDYYDDDGYYLENDDEDQFSEWFEGYKKRKGHKTSIKEDLLPIGWHPSRYWDWCMSEDEKQETEKLWV